MMEMKGLGFVFSTLGTMDQPGWWPPEYVLGAAIVLMILMLLLGWRALVWILGRREDAES